MGEDGPAGLGRASQDALDAAQIIMAPPRHLDLLGPSKAQLIPWPVPYADGIAQLLGLRGQRVVVLASGDPFWFGAGSVLARHLSADEWSAHPGVSIFSLVAARLAWPLEKTNCVGLHAAPLSRLRPYLTNNSRIIVLLRDGAAVEQLAEYLCDTGFGASMLDIFECAGGPREIHTQFRADSVPDQAFTAPVCAAITCTGDAALPRANGLADSYFDSDGTMTKAPVRALTLSALAPRPSEHLWDIGGGSGSIAIEWLLAHPTTQASCIEPRGDRAANISANAAKLGVDRLNLVVGMAPDALTGLPDPDAVFIGGGLSQSLLDILYERLAPGTRLVANAVTLETEVLLANAHAARGGSLMRFDIAAAAPLGSKRGWRASFPIVQWSVTL